MTKLQRVLVMGAGPAGLTAAYELLRLGRERFDVEVLEADPQYVGGLARTVEFDGYRADVGGHRFFSKNEEVEALWRELLGDDLLTRDRMSRILYDGRLFHYPLRAGNALAGLGPVTAARVLASYARARLRPIRPERSFADWVSNRFGRELFRIFFRSYTEKVWGISCEELSADWAAQRIKGLSLSAAIRGALPGRRRSGDVETSLIESFRYPRLGPGMMWEAARDRIVELGGRVRMDSRVTEVRRSRGRLTWLKVEHSDGSSERLPGDHFISSMPIGALARALRPVADPETLAAADGLAHRGFLTVVLMVRRRDLFPDNWIYVHDDSVQVGRLQNFKAWSPEMVPDPATTTVGMEYFCDPGDALWSLDDDALIDLGIRELSSLGFARADEIGFGRVIRAANAYPVYDEGYTDRLATLRRALGEDAANLQAIGRSGMHRYNNQDHSMMTGLLAARNLLGGSFDPWQVNAEAAYLEG